MAASLSATNTLKIYSYSMKKIIFTYLISILFIECSSSKNWSTESAQNEVWQIIVKTEKKINNKEFVDSREVEKIANLSNIVSKNQVMWHQAYYDVETKDIRLWKEWFNKNKLNLSYFEKADIYKYYYRSKKEKIIKFEYETDKFRYSIHELELKRIQEITDLIKRKN